MENRNKNRHTAKQRPFFTFLEKKNQFQFTDKDGCYSV